MQRITQILGSRIDPAFAERLHGISHHGVVESLVVPVADLARRRFVGTTTGGRDVAIALPRDQKLFDGAVLSIEDERALVVRVGEERWLRVEPLSADAALELGYHAGNLHWRVRFEGACLLIALEGAAEDYLARLGTLVTDGRVVADLPAPHPDHTA